MTPTRSRLLIAITTAALALTVVGCSPATSNKAPTREADWQTKPSALWTADGDLMSAPRVIGDTALAYVATGGGREAVVAWDASNGRELWRHTAVPGDQAPGVDHVIPIVKRDDTTYTAYLAPLPAGLSPWWGSITVVDVRTGTPHKTTSAEQDIYGTRPHACASDTFCLSGLFDGESRSRQLQYSFATGTLRPPWSTGDDDSVPFSDSGMMVGTYVSVTDHDNVQMLRGGRDDKIEWERPYTDVFGAGASTGAGWSWNDGDQNLPAIGIGGVREDHDYTKAFDGRVDFAAGRMVALDQHTGATAWSVEGVNQCPATKGLGIVDDVVVACRFRSGSFIWHWNGQTAADMRVSDLDVDLIGVNAHSGKILWTVPLDPDPANAAALDDAGALAEASTPIAFVRGRASTIDPKTGAVTALPADAALLCIDESASVGLFSPYADDWGERHDYPLADRLTPCSTRHARLDDAAITYGTLTTFGYDTSKPVVINLTSGITAFSPQPASPTPGGDVEG